MITSKRVKRHRAGLLGLGVSAISVVVSALVLVALPGCSRKTPRDPLAAKFKLKELGITYDESSFVKAARDRNQRVVEVFLDTGMDPNARGDSGRTALMEAAHYGYQGIVRMLIGRSADVSLTDDGGLTALHLAAEGPFSYQCVEILLDHGASPHARTITGDTPLGRAVIMPLKVPTAEYLDQNYIKTVKALLERGADVNAKLAHGVTPLMRAAVVGHPDMVRLLLDHGADPNAKSDDGKTPQAYAILYHNDDIARLINASIN